MLAKITLKVTKGKLAGQEYVFDERNTCIVGRSPECNPQVPNDKDHKVISRHHCMLDINPPDVRVRDFGSLNGTWVNGTKIGQRERDQTPEEGQRAAFPEHDLKDGDEITLGNTTLQVSILVPTCCGDCGGEIPEENKQGSEVTPGFYRCEACHRKAKDAVHDMSRKAKVCAKCGKDVSAEMGKNRHGEYLCESCRKEPIELLKRLLGLAKRGNKDAVAIKGYKIIKELGRGGMGAVYLAERESGGERVALKVMLPQIAMDENAKESFLREVQNTRALRHDNVVALYDYGCCEGAFFFTLEFCDGGSVESLMKARGGKLPVKEATNIIVQSLRGLEYAHNAEIPYVKLADGRVGKGKGLVHRDLKPGNLFLCGAGDSLIAKVGDFGLAKAFDTAGLSGQTRTGVAMGTPVFMPRQQVINFKYAKPDVDVWAMAATLYFMLTCMCPRDFYVGVDPWQTVLQTDPVPIRQRDASIPAPLADLLDTALRDKPAIHFSDAGAFRRELEEVL
jgi:serine/threonine-protein kinase